MSKKVLYVLYSLCLKTNEWYISCYMANLYLCTLIWLIGMHLVHLFNLWSTFATRIHAEAIGIQGVLRCALLFGLSGTSAKHEGSFVRVDDILPLQHFMHFSLVMEERKGSAMTAFQCHQAALSSQQNVLIVLRHLTFSNLSGASKFFLFMCQDNITHFCF